MEQKVMHYFLLKIKSNTNKSGGFHNTGINSIYYLIPILVILDLFVYIFI